MQIAKNSVVSLDYRLTDGDGQMIDSSEGQEPLAYIHGHGFLIPGLENELEGRASGDSLQVVVKPEDGYGLRDEELVDVVSREMFADVDELQVGMQFQAETDDGVSIVTITGIDGDDVTVDGNHPLADKTLHFDVTVVDVREASAEELDHGHVHGPGGHHH